MAMLHTSGNRSIIERGWTYEALLLGLEYAVQLRNIGMVQNFHLWELKHRIEAYFFGYAGLYAGPKGVPYDQIDLWSEKAIEEFSKDKSNVRNFIKEHGTPTTVFAAKILDIYLNGKLTKEVMDHNFETFYKLAVITKAEDGRLNTIGARSKMYETPHMRWVAAGIKIVNRKDRACVGSPSFAAKL
jgi:hypothetical protein